MSFSLVAHVKMLLGCLSVVIFAIQPRKSLRFARDLVLILSPLFPIAAANALWTYRASNLAEIKPGGAAGMLPTNTHRNRIIWIIFDELDQRMLFDQRPSRVHLDQFDALRQQSVYATSATAPNQDTLPSLQSLLTGQNVTAFRLHTSDLDFTTKNCLKWQDFHSVPNIFSRARKAGFDTALSGWHHPYCRVIGNDLSQCAWAISAQGFLVAEEALNAQSFFGKALYLAKWQAESFPYRSSFGILPEPGGVESIKQVSIQTYRFVTESGERMLLNPSLNLILLHIPIPHPPGIWDVPHRSFTKGRSNYIDNLQLANEALGHIRGALVASGQWDDATVLVSADHPYRAGSWEDLFFIRSDEVTALTHKHMQPFIPFLLKLPGQQTGFAYNKPFDTVLTADLLLACLNGAISDPQQAATWLDAHIRTSLDPAEINCPERR